MAGTVCLLGDGFESGRSGGRRLAARGFVGGRLLERMSRFSLRRADNIIALDRFMRDRIAAKGIAPEKIAVLPPWSHDSEVRFDAGGTGSKFAGNTVCRTNS